uniref:NADH-ubiquinone oxidoreductase chain 2 n=1 Tax=Heteromycteris japonicus TaxID=195614 RepID=A0A088AXA7_9PLEU|nr:NADH dehydrogenase subunit 2 [Heteromycteris japonicus]AFC77832.1 NADH dehydrogenase subunit 2 [Heteromycteris japonicus]
MPPVILFFLITSLTIGTSIVFSSSHWLLAWIGLEINSLAIIPIMTRTHNPRATEAVTKYFLTQAAASATILFATLINATHTGEWGLQCLTDSFSILIITTALCFKLGLAPMHVWMPEVYQGVDLLTAMLLATWQKLAPFSIIMQLNPGSSNFLFFMGMLSVLIGGLGGLSQNQMRKILAYSSISHMGWMIIILQYQPQLTLLALLTYLVMTFSMFMVLHITDATDMNRLAMSWAKMPVITALTPLILLSLGGLPPLTGFLPKWLILAELAKQGLGAMATIVALTTLLSLYFYLRLGYAIFITISMNTNLGTTTWRQKATKMLLPLAASTMMTLASLPLAPSLLALLTIT